MQEMHESRILLLAAGCWYADSAAAEIIVVGGGGVILCLIFSAFLGDPPSHNSRPRCFLLLRKEFPDSENCCYIINYRRSIFDVSIMDVFLHACNN
jgi:hypothetical protein